MTDEEMGIVRDPETGRIVSRTLTSEKAAEMARKRHSKPIADDTLALVQEAGFETLKEAPTHFRLTCEKAATGDIRGIIEYKKWTEKTTAKEADKPQETKPGKLYMADADGKLQEAYFADEAQADLMKYIQMGRKERPKEGAFSYHPAR